MNSQVDADAASDVGVTPKSYDECLKEVLALKADKDYGNWGAQTRPNKGRELTPESLDMSPEFVDGWAKAIDGLFEKRPNAAEN